VLFKHQIKVKIKTQLTGSNLPLFVTVNNAFVYVDSNSCISVNI